MRYSNKRKGSIVFKVVLMIWFVVSGLIETFSSILFRIWLWRRGVRFKYGMMAGIPGILECGYVRWRRSQERSPNRLFLIFRFVSMINVIVSAYFCAINY
jgi:hypothetical protein